MPTTKKVISAFCATILFLMCTISTACASNTGINPYMDHIALGQCSLDIDGTTAKVNAWVEGRTYINKGELGTPDAPTDKRKYIEEHGSFNACFSLNKRTVPSPAETYSGKMIYTVQPNGKPDKFFEIITKETK